MSNEKENKQIELQKQISMIEKFYTKTYMSHLVELLGKENVTDAFLKEKGWKKEKDYVVIVNKSDCNKFSAKQAMKDLEFLGKMNVQLDKIVQAHAIAKGYDTGKEQKTQ